MDEETLLWELESIRQASSPLPLNEELVSATRKLVSA